MIDTYKYKKNGYNEHINTKFKIENKTCLIFDNRNWNEKKVFKGYDIGIENNKKLSRRKFIKRIGNEC